MTDPFERIKQSLDENLFVEASAGTGKTRALVDRVVALVSAGVPITEIVAITFTEKAAAELKERIRSELERLHLEGGPGSRPGKALDALDAATISTIHSFASAVIRASAAEAGVDPDFTVMDEVETERHFGDRWLRFLERLVDDATATGVVTRAVRLGLTAGDMRTLARALWQRPDLARLEPEQPPAPSTVWGMLPAWSEALAAVPLDGREGDPLATTLSKLRGLVERLNSLTGAEREAVLAADNPGSLKFGRSSRPERQLGEEIREGLTKALEAARAQALADLLPHTARFALEESQARCREGRLTFDDLIRVARDLVVGDAGIRARLRKRYRCLLIDEFQDTDPWQFDLAMGFATDPETGRPEPGRLFLVGDPKQSIYRFRKADMAIYSRARAAVEASGQDVALLASRRSTAPIVEWVNRVFGALFGDDDPDVSPAYQAMVALRSDAPAGPTMAVVGGKTELSADELRQAEARHIAQVCAEAIRTPWEVADRTDGPGTSRRATYGDIAVLVRTRSLVPDLERAFAAAGIPARVDSGSLVFQTQEVRDLINLLTAIDSPADAVAVVAALRSAALGCSDADLARHKRDGGTFNYLREQAPAGAVSHALHRLRGFHEAATGKTLAELTQAALDETGLLAAGVFDRGDRDGFRRARFVVEAARTFEADGPQPVRAFVAWLEERSSAAVVDHDGAALDDDEDSVRIMTVHGSKGLEFPIVVAAGFGASAQAETAPVLSVSRETGGLVVCVGSKTRSAQFILGAVDSIVALEKGHADAELVRLMYVAATRARDHLVFSLYSGKRAGGCGTLLVEQAGGAVGVASLPLVEAPAGRMPAPFAGIDVDLRGDGGVREFLDGRRLLAERARTLRVTSATALTARAAEHAEAAAEWSSGRGGTHLGRAVHAVVQSTPADGPPEVLRAFARAQAVAEGIPGREADITALASRAFESQAMARARPARRATREVPFAVEIDGTVVEGFVDMLVDGDGGLEIIDWKTDDITEAEVGRRMAQYELQAGLYVLGITRATGRPVRRVTYVFLSPGVERDMGEPGRLMDVALARLAAAE